MTHVQTRPIEYGILTYIYDDKLTMKNSTRCIVSLSRMLKSIREEFPQSNWIIYFHHKLDVKVRCLVVDLVGHHEFSFESTTDEFEKNYEDIAKECIDEWKKSRR